MLRVTYTNSHKTVKPKNDSYLEMIPGGNMTANHENFFLRLHLGIGLEFSSKITYSRQCKVINDHLQSIVLFNLAKLVFFHKVSILNNKLV